MTYAHAVKTVGILFVLAAPVSLKAQWVSSRDARPLAAVSARADLQLVEAEALLHPGLPSAHVDPPFWRENVLPGSADRRCVDVPQDGPVRSGDFTVWYNSLYRPRAGEEHKVAWVPSENSREMALRVRAQLIGDPSVSFDWTSTSIGRSLGVGQDWFFPSGTTFSAAGEWVVVATSANNWGCFVFEVTEASISPS